MPFNNNSDARSTIFTHILFATVSLLISVNSAFALSGDRHSLSTTPQANQTIELKFQDDELSAVTAEISQRSGVRFSVSTSLLPFRVSKEVTATNWSDAIKSVLAGFSYLSTVDRSGQFQKIWLTGTEDPSIASGGISKRSKRAGEEAKEAVLKELPVALWEPVAGKAVDSPWGESAHAEPILMDPALFDTLEVGQPVEIPIPQQAAPVYGVIGENHSQLNGEVQVWSGPVDGSHETASFTITRGQKGTYATVATGTSIYEVSVDNATGVGTVVDEVELTKNVNENDFIIPDHPH